MSLQPEKIFNFNSVVLDEYLKSEVERLVALRFDVLKEKFSKQYSLDDYLMSRCEVAEKLNIGIGKFDGLVKKKKLTAYRIGKHLKFKNSEIQTYIKNLSPTN